MKFLLSQAKDPDDALVKRVTEKLISKVYSEAYNEFAQDQEALAAEFAHEIRQKQAFYDMCKDARNP